MRPRLVGSPALNGTTDQAAHPGNQAGMVSHPGGDARPVKEIDKKLLRIWDVGQGREHRFATIGERAVGRVRPRAYNDVRTRLIGKTLDRGSDTSIGPHLRSNTSRGHIWLLDLIANLRARNKSAADGLWRQINAHVDAAVARVLIASPRDGRYRK